MKDIGNSVFMGSFTRKGDPDFFIIEEIECFDIDWPWQFKVAETMYYDRDNII